MSLLFIGILLAVLLACSIALVSFEQCLLHWRYRLLNASERQTWEKNPPLSWLRDQKQSTLGSSLRQLQLTFYSLFGGLLLLFAHLWVEVFETDTNRVLLFSLFLLGGILLQLAGCFGIAPLLVKHFRIKTFQVTSVLVLGLAFLWSPVETLLRRLSPGSESQGDGHSHDGGILDSFDTEVQLRALAKEDYELKPLMRQILRNGLRMSALEVSDVLLPRNHVQFFNLQEPVEENLKNAKESGHTRFPLCDGDLDHCVGLIHIKDIFQKHEAGSQLDLRRMRRNISSISVEIPIDEALQRLLRRKMHMALVVDEFGGTVGVVTLESILEELVGDIQDEFDREEKMINPTGQNRYRVSGLTAIHECEEYWQVSLENNDVSTFGGLLTYEMGRIPDRGEQVDLLNGRLKVWIDEVDEKRVICAVTEWTDPPQTNEGLDSSAK